MIGFDPARPVVVEAESSKIGEINLPPSLWAAMKDAPWIEVSAPIAARTSYLVEAYADILADPETLREKLAPLRQFRGHGSWMIGSRRSKRATRRASSKA